MGWSKGTKGEYKMVVMKGRRREVRSHVGQVVFPGW